MSVANTFEVASALGCNLPELPSTQEWYVLGGIAVAALLHGDINRQTKRVTLSSMPDLPTERTNGTRRDIDILVRDTLAPDDAKKLCDGVSKIIRHGLDVSVFGFEEYLPRVSGVQRVRRMATEGWLSARTIKKDAASLKILEIRHELGPISVPVDPAMYDPWRITLPDKTELPILHPIATLLAYKGRSVGGPRPKDKEKIEKLEKCLSDVFGNVNGVVDTIDFNPAWQFVQAVGALASGDAIDKQLLRPSVTLVDVGIARTKARVVRWAEAHPSIVNGFQRNGIQRALGRWTGTR